MSGHSHSLARDICPDLDGPTVESQLDREHGGDVRAWAKKALIDPGQIIDFSASVNPLGPPASARKAFQKSYGEVSRYPDPYGEELKEALAKRQEMKPAEFYIRVRQAVRASSPDATVYLMFRFEDAVSHFPSRKKMES